MNNKLYTIKENNLNNIEKSEEENKKIKIIKKNVKEAKNVLVSQIPASSYLMIEIFEKDKDTNKATKIAAENKNNIHYLKINGKQQNI